MTHPTARMRLERMLESFVRGPDRSIARANDIESAFVSEFGDDDERFGDFILALASYRPGGGEFLYREADVIRMCREALRNLHEVR